MKRCDCTAHRDGLPWLHAIYGRYEREIIVAERDVVEKIANKINSKFLEEFCAGRPYARYILNRSRKGQIHVLIIRHSCRFQGRQEDKVDIFPPWPKNVHVRVFRLCQQAELEAAKQEGYK